MELCATGPRCTICYGRPHYHECLRRIQQYATSLAARLEGPCRTESMAGANYRQRDGAVVSLAGRFARGQSLARSEERRVGEECRSRWSAYHLKKKRRQSTV